MSGLIQRGGSRLVVGFGITGVAVAQYFIDRQTCVMVVDERVSPSGLDADMSGISSHDFFESLFGSAFTDVCQSPEALRALLGSFEEIVVSPGVPPSHPLLEAARELKIPIVNDIVVFLRHIKGECPDVKLVAITGSNGKSTVTDAIAKTGLSLGLAVHAVGNIGLPVLTVLNDLGAKDILVIELSSYQLELVHDLGADVAVLLNMSEDHLDRHGDMQTYWHAKQKVYEGAKAVVVNRDDPLSAPLSVHQSTQGLAAYIRFGISAPDRDDFGVIDRSGTPWLAKGIEPLIPLDQFTLEGNHNYANFMVVLAVAQCLGWSLQESLQYLQGYTGLTYRCQLENTQDEITWINDSKGTNVGASLVALQFGLAGIQGSGGLWWIGGGLAKGADFMPIASFLSDKVLTRLRGCCLYGQDHGVIFASLQEQGLEPIFIEDDLEAVVRKIKSLAQPGDAVVFSPACASMDQFKNFEERGFRFAEFVKNSSY